MKGTIKNILIGSYNCSLYLPPKYYSKKENYDVIYINGDFLSTESLENLECLFESQCKGFIILGIMSDNWNKDFTPWPSKKVFKKSEDFSGNALKYLEILENTIKPYIDENYRTNPAPHNTSLIGYSLGGLASLYAIYNFKSFGKIASISGSLWYENWINFITSNSPINPSLKIYLSLGKDEEKSKNPRIRSVSTCTNETLSILQHKLISENNITLEWNEGGHFKDVEERFEKAILWLMK
ncbi:alpha/beta hydrolase [Haloimpatiens sp. FM7315]|uniref:alpha/beta hydrolase n=1 Tax=Haloimpatiens sp. FM7315 TaxID=3298609 RepID=UPI0039777D2D